jgi:hypothetical protein
VQGSLNVCYLLSGSRVEKIAIFIISVLIGLVYFSQFPTEAISAGVDLQS